MVLIAVLDLRIIYSLLKIVCVCLVSIDLGMMALRVRAIEKGEEKMEQEVSRERFA